MADARSRAAWDHTASVLWLVATVNRNPKRPKPKLADFHPYMSGRRSQPVSVERLAHEVVRMAERKRGGRKRREA